MPREKYDQFAKELLKTVLEPLGTATSGVEIPGEPLDVDVTFEASSDLMDSEREAYGLPGRLIAPVALFEPYRRALELEHLWNGTAKLSWSWLAARRKAENGRDMTPLPLWIITPSAPPELVADFGFSPAHQVLKQELNPDWWERRTWPAGVYSLGRRNPLGLVVLNELPEVRETLTLRLMAKGRTLKRAITEVRSLKPNDPLRTPVLHLLTKWRIIDVKAPEIEPEEREVVMYAQLTYQQWCEIQKAEGRNEGRTEGRNEGRAEGRNEAHLETLRDVLQRFWVRRFGPLPAGLQARLATSTYTVGLENGVDILAEAHTSAEAEARLMKALEAPPQ